MVKVEVSGKTDVGRKRSNNQDSFLIDEGQRLFAVADGMGGHSGGEVASALAVKTLQKIFSESKQMSVSIRLEQSVQIANRVIYEHAHTNSGLLGMGTTLTAAVVTPEFLHVAQVGDSRCYLFRDGEIFQITEDHSQVYELIKAGILNENSSDLVQKNVITRSVGYEKAVRIDLYTRPVQSGDRYLICSDGLSGMVSDDVMAQVLYNHGPEQAVRNLVDLANLNGGEDNVSVIVFEIL